MAVIWPCVGSCCCPARGFFARALPAWHHGHRGSLGAHTGTEQPRPHGCCRKVTFLSAVPPRPCTDALTRSDTWSCCPSRGSSTSSVPTAAFTACPWSNRAGEWLSAPMLLALGPPLMAGMGHCPLPAHAPAGTGSIGWFGAVALTDHCFCSRC